MMIFPVRLNALPEGKTLDKTEVDVVISVNATGQETKAADQLIKYLSEIYPAYQFSVKTSVKGNNYTIRMGLPAFIGEPVSKEIPLQEEGFLIQALNNKNLIIASRTPKGLFNAVYSLLEKLGYGFYLSYEGKPLPKSELTFKEWEMSDFPLQGQRIVFDWHNFLSGCTGWNYEDWCSWIDQSAKMRYNTIMVHAYGNNPMFSFEYNGIKKETGYLTTSVSGRDWGAQHVNDVGRLPGGQVFSDPIFGSTAALVPDSQRGKAATELMAKVFKHAEEMAMKINFAIDVDTWSANPRNIIESLPSQCRIKLDQQDIINPETQEGYQYYKAQIKSLLTSYPQISTITVWVRHERSLWRDNISPEQFPESWQIEWREIVTKHPEIEKDIHGPSTFALSKIVLAYQKTLQEIKREDVSLAFGSWKWSFLASAAILMPENCTLIPLDYNIDIDSKESQKVLSSIGRMRKLIPIVWAQHDDHRYMGKPYTPYANFNSLLKERNAAGFGIIHWTTRPLDLFFKSLADQVWNLSENKNLASTLTDYSQTIFGHQQAALNEYLTEWICKGPMFGRETTDHFYDVGKQIVGEKYEPTEVAIERIKSRITILNGVDRSKLSEQGMKMINYYSAMEQFYLNLFQNQDKFYKAYDLIERQNIDSAKIVLQTTSPEKTIELYSKASAILPMTSGEKALIISMGTRWLPDFVNLKQRAGMADICYKFEATQHDTLAQQPGASTYFIDKENTLWSCLGKKELGTGVPEKFNNKEANDLPEVSQTYMKMSAPFIIPLVTIGKNQLAQGRYNLEIKYKSDDDKSGCKLFLVNKAKHLQLQADSRESGAQLKTISCIFEIDNTQKYTIEVDPGVEGKRFTNMVIRPLK